VGDLASGFVSVDTLVRDYGSEGDPLVLQNWIRTDGGFWLPKSIPDAAGGTIKILEPVNRPVTHAEADAAYRALDEVMLTMERTKAGKEQERQRFAAESRERTKAVVKAQAASQAAAKAEAQAAREEGKFDMGEYKRQLAVLEATKKKAEAYQKIRHQKLGKLRAYCKPLMDRARHETRKSQSLKQSVDTGPLSEDKLVELHTHREHLKILIELFRTCGKSGKAHPKMAAMQFLLDESEGLGNPLENPDAAARLAALDPELEEWKAAAEAEVALAQLEQEDPLAQAGLEAAGAGGEVHLGGGGKRTKRRRRRKSRRKASRRKASKGKSRRKASKIKSRGRKSTRRRR